MLEFFLPSLATKFDQRELSEFILLPLSLPPPGPFTTVEMCEWFQAGYFTMTLLVKRGCDEGFQPLGDVIKMWGRVPFAPGPSPPPLLVRQPPPTQRPQPTRGPAGTVSQSSANVEDGEGRMQRRGKIDRQVTVKDQQFIQKIQFNLT